MELVKVTIDAPKELNEVRQAIVELVKDLKAGKPLAVVAAENLALLAQAIDGAQKIPAEYSADLEKSAAVSGLMGGEIVGALLKPQVQPVPAEA